MTQFFRPRAMTGVALALVLSATAGTPLAMAQDQAPAQGLPQTPALSQTPRGVQGPESVADLAEGLLDAVVNISTSQRVEGRRSVPIPQVPEGSPFEEFFDEFLNRQDQGQDNQPRRVQSLGSGFVIDPSGIIVTNNHVIEGADEITANFSDGSKLKAELIGTDKKTDLAVLKVSPEKPLVAVPFGNSNEIRVGDWVMAIGNPFGLGGTVTVGIVSARNRNINAGPYDDFIQTDAAINRGNSGGPLFDMEGRVVGINTAIISPSGGSIGIGFAIPANIATSVIAQLRQFGETRRGWLGVRIQEVTDDIAESLSMPKASGALVAGVTEGGPAAAAGLEPGDVIVTFDGREVPEMDDLPRMVADTAIGKAVDVEVLRKGERKTIKVELGRLEDGETAAASPASTTPAEPAAPTAVLGLKLSELTPALKEQFKLADTVKGVVVTEVDPASAAAEKRIQAGDVIVEVAQEAITTPADVAAKVDALKKDGRKSALFLLSNASGEVRFVAVRIDG
ncbi:DegQ family serine endoprotease [Pseudoxanthobacter sp. M-2]|uniref:DegQ family serine endoprotease n=1 Tax=Pseudoxanthobacter sp. M-2 TaxID=3078754 RepID=UPI0038FCFA05